MAGSCGAGKDDVCTRSRSALSRSHDWVPCSPSDRAALLDTYAARARDVFGDRVLWHVSATGRGGGVAEMLQTLLAYGQGAGIENRWLVLDGDPHFFAITKRVHNMLHGDPGDGRDLGAAERAHYAAVLSRNLDDMLSVVSPGDIVLLHDPQTAGLAQALRTRGLHVVWRCHVGRDEPSEPSTAAWEFLRPFLAPVEMFVFSRLGYAPVWVDPPGWWSSRRRSTRSRRRTSSCQRRGGRRPRHRGSGGGRGAGRGGLRAPRRGVGHRPARVRPGARRPRAPRDARLIVQVSRWDRLKDMPGVMAAFALMASRRPGDRTHLMLAGPAAAGVTDDPEGAEVLAECRESWRALPPDVRERVHLAAIPLDDVDENAIVVNALQRHAFAVVQKSLVEGFGLTVTEAMWKGKAVVASKVGGIQDQIVDGLDGLLIEDPRDLEACAVAFGRLLDEAGLCPRLGKSARARVSADFVGDRHLEQYADLLARMIGAADA